MRTESLPPAAVYSRHFRERLDLNLSAPAQLRLFWNSFNVNCCALVWD